MTLVSEEHNLADKDVATAPSSSVTVAPQPKREWHVKTICVAVFIVALVLISSILVPVLAFTFLGEVSIFHVML